MTFQPRTKYWFAVAGVAINLVGGLFAAGSGEPLHAGTHAVLTVVFALWAQRLRQELGQTQIGSELEDRLADIESEIGSLRQELSDAHERLDFAERVLAQKPEARRVDQQRQDP